MKAVIIAWSTLVVLAGTEPAAAQQTEFYGAIAYSPRTRTVGVSSDNPSRGEAESVAMQNCRVGEGAPTDCREAGWVKNGCTILAVSERGAWGSGWGNTEEAAKRNAIAKCAQFAKNDPGSCRIVRTVCTSGDPSEVSHAR